MRKIALIIIVLNTVNVIAFGQTSVVDENAIFPPLPITPLKTTDIKCNEDSDLYIKSIKNVTLWAYEIYNANAIRPSGIFSGNVADMGNYEQCLSAKAPFPVQYCLMTVTANIPKPKTGRDPLSLYHDPYESVLEKLYKYDDPSQFPRNTIKMGWCVPASCPVTNLENYHNIYLNQIDYPLKKYNVTFTSKLSPIYCQSQENDEDNLSFPDIVFCALTLIILSTVILSTICDVITSSPTTKEIDHKLIKKTFRYALITSFSVKRNYRTLKKNDKNNPTIKILYGIRTFGMAVIILSHRIAYTLTIPLENYGFIEKIYRSTLIGFITCGDLSVEIFFVLSGLLLTYNIMNKFEENSVKPSLIVVMRYIRLTPVYAFVIFFYATIYRFFGNGPLWKVINESEIQDCRDNWWANLLYIQNYINADHMCLLYTWYLACDFNYFLTGLGLCLLIRKNKNFGLITLTGLTIISSVVPFVITYFSNISPILIQYPDILTNPKAGLNNAIIYNKTHARGTTYFIGMFTGFLYYKFKKIDGYLNNIKSVAILSLSIFLILTPIISTVIFFDPYHKNNALESATYAALHRSSFALGTIGLLFIASFGKDRKLYKILTLSPLIPLSKLVYSAYLVHVLLQIKSVGDLGEPKYFTLYDMFAYGFGDIVLAFFIAFLLYLGIEAPCKKIFIKMLTPSSKFVLN